MADYVGDHVIVMVEGALAADRLLAARGIDRPPELNRLLLKLDEVEWSGVTHGQGSGPMGSGNDGAAYACCPTCGGLKEPNGEFIESAVGHRSGCRLAAALGRPTVAPEDGQERMPV
jgi:hypothetical protein